MIPGITRGIVHTIIIAHGTRVGMPDGVGAGEVGTTHGILTDITIRTMVAVDITGDKGCNARVTDVIQLREIRIREGYHVHRAVTGSLQVLPQTEWVPAEVRAVHRQDMMEQRLIVRQTVTKGLQELRHVKLEYQQDQRITEKVAVLRAVHL